MRWSQRKYHAGSMRNVGGALRRGTRALAVHRDRTGRSMSGGWDARNWIRQAANLGLALQPKQHSATVVEADIVIFGGAAFGGKARWLIMRVLEHIAVATFGFVLFRRTTKQITNEGALWDESEKVYRLVGATSKRLEWNFPSGARGRMAHMEHEKDRYSWDGAQIPFIGFDQLEHFTAKQFFYLLSRNRTTIGIKPKTFATCNPDPDSFLATFLAWWIDQETGYPIPNRSGKVRYFIRDGDDIVWGDSRSEIARANPHLIAHDPDAEIKSITFVASYLEDNAIGMAADPGYVGNLNALPLVDRERLKRGNWKIRPAAGLLFKREYFEVVDHVPDAQRSVRGWDLAATDEEDAIRQGIDPAWTVGIKMILGVDGIYYITAVRRLRGSPHKVRVAVQGAAAADGASVTIRLPQDPGQAGKAQVQDMVADLAGFTVRFRPMTGDKVTRAGGLSSQAEARNIKLLRAPWNDILLDQFEAFPDAGLDEVDAAVEAFDEIKPSTHAGESIPGPASTEPGRKVRV